LPLLPLLPLLLLPGCVGQEPIFHADWGFDSYEVTTPRRLSLPGGPRGDTRQVSYLLQVQGQRLVLRLRPQRLLLPRNLQVFSFTPQGRLVEDHPYVPRGCSYAGAVQGAPESGATVSTCMGGGLRGVLSIGARRYQIEPLKASPSFEHVVYLLKNEARPLRHLCPLAEEGAARQAGPEGAQATARDRAQGYPHTKYLEMALAFDHGRYLYSQSNLSEVVSDGIIMAGIMDTFFQDVHLRIHLSALEVWTDRDKINLNAPEISLALKQFVDYRTVSINPRVTHDWAHLYFTKLFLDSITAHSGNVCSASDSGSMSAFREKNLHIPVTFAAHALGHVLRMQHDTEYCVCQGRNSCLMGTGVSGFSNCSYVDFLAYTNVDAHCLNNIPETRFELKTCGNKIVEENEQCDCGSGEECKHDPCCQADCKLRRGANCSTGLCCDNCRLRPPGYLCRREENECDLAEYCNGRSAVCPEDLYKRDGTPCKYEASCFKKGCRSRYMQCQSIFGPEAREAPSQCYEAVNTIGDQYGNCRVKGMNSYEVCSRQNSLCGRIQCINVKSIPSLPDHYTVISTHLGEENLECWGVGYHLSMAPMGIPDVGVISDGTSCGMNRVCMNRTCVERQAALQSDCLPEQCNYRGVCNNRKHCHCMYGWAPPFCEVAGFGGSVDSGPAGTEQEKVPFSVYVAALLFSRLALFVISVIIVFFKNTIKNFLMPKQAADSSMIAQGARLKAKRITRPPFHLWNL
ncbi:PREDICTED: disintegrin and metalloproteinase domain-containing protein 30, partial [Condylura cristata]|uniref:disintegrin and metalloproteinase domain-containing protein 30 n=1 Tax=Condylura cristata TaxID=143302 RepID=UPI0003347EBB